MMSMCPHDDSCADDVAPERVLRLCSSASLWVLHDLVLERRQRLVKPIMFGEGAFLKVAAQSW